MRTYVDWSKRQIETKFGTDFGEWRLVKEQNGSEEVQISNGDVNYPMHAFTVWSNGELAIRFVADRGYEHIDIECTDSAGHRSWVPFEIVGLAADLWNEETSAHAVHEWYAQLDVENPNTVPISLFNDPLDEISRNMSQIKVAANDPQEISEAEGVVSKVASESLKELREKSKKRSKNREVDRSR